MHSNVKNKRIRVSKINVFKSIFINKIENKTIFNFFLLTYFFLFIYNAFKLEVICQNM
jgi:hypothetical protein